MKPFRIDILPTVEDDVAQLANWIESHDGSDRADHFVDVMLKAMSTLSTLARRGVAVTDVESTVFGETRQLLKLNCRIIYVVDEEVVTVIAVIHQRRDLTATLAERNEAMSVSIALNTRRRRRNTSR